MIKQIFKSKMMNFGTMLVAAGFLEQNAQTVSAMVPEEYRGLAISLVGAVVWGLRWVTTKPLSQK